MMIKIFTIVLLLFGSAIAVGAQDKPEKENSESPPERNAKKANKRPAAEEVPAEPFDKTDIKTMAAKCVELKTGKGLIKLEMFPDSAPETVRNFLNLTAIGAFETTTFSRVVPDFVIQGGDLSTHKKYTHALSKRAFRTITDEPNLIKHERGIISMARSEEPNSASTSFFILVSAASSLDGTFAAFGRVISGMKVVDTINKMPVDGETPKEPVQVLNATVVACPAKPKQ